MSNHFILFSFLNLSENKKIVANLSYLATKNSYKLKSPVFSLNRPKIYSEFISLFKNLSIFFNYSVLVSSNIVGLLK